MDTVTVTWTPDTWAAFCLIVEEAWAGEFTDEQRGAWRTLLEPYEPPAVVAALQRLVAKGGRFRPAVAEVVAELRVDPTVPTFDEMLRLVYGPRGALRARPSERLWGSEAERRLQEQAAVHDRAQQLHPLVASFIDRYGVDRLKTHNISWESGHWARKELREAWAAHLQATATRGVHALTTPDRSGLGMRRLDPLAALDITPDLKVLEGGDAA